MSLPKSKKELLRRWNEGEHFEFYLFYGHKPPPHGVDASCLSQWFQRDFVIDDIEYSTAEHWMMAEKARLFDDATMLESILDAPGPGDAKAFGRQVKGFDQKTWEQHRFEIVRRGNAAKFNQNEDLKDFLIDTAFYSDMPIEKVAEPRTDYSVSQESERSGESEDRTESSVFPIKNEPAASTSKVILVEAAGRDTIWGIGLGVNNPRSHDPTQWRGKNLLGFVLTTVREELTSN